MQNTFAYIIVPLLAWFTAQVVKVLITATKGKVRLRDMLASGSMPSSHTALVVGFVATALIIDGYKSPIFAGAVVVAIVVVYDAMNVRRAVGEHRIAILRLYDNFPKIKKKESADDILSTYESLGHTPKEVLAGGLIAVGTALVVLFSRYADARWFDQLPTDQEARTYRWIAVVMIVGGLLLGWAVGRFGRSLPTVQRLKASFWVVFIFPGIVALTLASMSLQDIQFLAGRAHISLVWTFSGAAFVVYLFSLYFNAKGCVVEDRKIEQVKKSTHRKKRSKKRKRK